MQLRIQQPDGEQQLVTLQADQSLRLGTHQKADVVLRGTGVFPVHFGIVYRNDAFYAAASKRARQIQVNGRRVTSARLGPGDTIDVGDVKVEVLAETPSSAAVELSELGDLPDLADPLTDAGLPQLDDATDALDDALPATSALADGSSSLPVEPDLDVVDAADAEVLSAPAAASGASEPSAVRRFLQSTTFKTLLLSAVLVPLLVLIALYIRQLPSAEERFREADAHYRAERWQPAIEAYERFLAWHSRSAYAGRARVARDLARLRQSLDRGEDAAHILQRADEALESWGDLVALPAAQEGLAALLPALIADLTQQGKSAAEADSPVRADQAFSQAATALDWLYRYVPPRLQRAQDVDQLQIHLTRLERKFNQQTVLQTALDRIRTMGSDGGLTAAYGPLDTLLNQYPELTANGQLRAAMRALAQAETARCQTESTPDTPQPERWQTPPHGTCLLATRPAPQSRDSAGRVIGVLLRDAGVLLGLDVVQGHVRWRRFVGFGSDSVAVPVRSGQSASLLLFDAQADELVCVDSRQGKEQWRVASGAPIGDPVVSAGHALVATRRKQLLRIDCATGTIGWRATLPQMPAAAPVVDTEGERCYVVADRGVSYVLALRTGRCLSVFYQAHDFASIRTRPILHREHLLVLEHVGPAYNKLHVLRAGDTLAAIQVLAIAGGVVGEPLMVDDRLLLPSPEPAQPHVLRWRPGRADRPLEVRHRVSAAPRVPAIGMTHLLAHGGRVWSGGEGLVEWTPDQEEGGVATAERYWPSMRLTQPMQVVDNRLIVVGRERQTPGVIARGLDLTKKQVAWECRLGIPVEAFSFDAADPQDMWLLRADGNVYRTRPGDAEPAVGSPGQNATVVCHPLSPPPGESHAAAADRSGSSGVEAAANGNPAPSPTAGIPVSGLHGSTWPLLTRAQRVRRIRIVRQDEGQPARLHTVRLPAPLATAPARVVLPAADGSGAAGARAASALEPRCALFGAVEGGPLCLLDPHTGAMLSCYLPPASDARRLPWQPLAWLPDNTALIGDGAHRLLWVRVSDQQRIELIKEAIVEVPLVGGLATFGQTAWGVDSGGQLVAITLPELAITRSPPLNSHVQWGPIQFDSGVYLATVEGEVYRLGEGTEPAWRITQSHGPVAGACTYASRQLLFASASGRLWQVNAESGRQGTANIDLYQPLSGGPVAFGTTLIVFTLDGAMLTLSESTMRSQLREAIETAE